MHCYGAIRDDLHDYAAEVLARMDTYVMAQPIDQADFGRFDTMVVHRAGRLQVELVRIKSNVLIPPHRHPGVDSIDLLVGGNVVGFDIDEQHFDRFVKGMGLRIPASARHGGATGRFGVIFLSCQRWDREPDFIAKRWVGDPVNQHHERMLEHFKAVA